MATLKDLAERLKGFIGGATPAGQLYQSFQRDIPQGRQAIQQFAQNHPRATKLAMNFEPVHNFVQRTVASIPQNPVNFQGVRNWANTNPLFPQLPTQVRNAVNMPFKAGVNVGTGIGEGYANALPQFVYNAYRLPQSKTPTEFIGKTAGILEGVGTLGTPKAIKQGISSVINQPQYIKNPLMQSIKQGAYQGAQMGGAFGALGGARQNQDSEWNQLKGTIMGAGTGAVIGGVLGAGTSAIARTGKVIIDKIQGDARTQAKTWTKQLLSSDSKLRPSWMKQFKSQEEVEEYLYKYYRNQLAVSKAAELQRKLPQVGMSIKSVRKVDPKIAVETELGISKPSSPVGGEIGGVKTKQNIKLLNNNKNQAQINPQQLGKNNRGLANTSVDSSPLDTQKVKIDQQTALLDNKNSLTSKPIIPQKSNFEAEMDAMVQNRTPITGKTQIEANQSQRINNTDVEQMKATAQIKTEGNQKEWKSIISRWLGNNKNAELEGYQFGTKFDKTNKTQAEELIKGLESGNVREDLKPLADKYRQLDDQVFAQAKESGMDIRYLRDHVSHIWKEGATQVQQQYQKFKFKYGLNNSRTIPSYEEGIKMGLTPRYTDPRQILGYQIKQLLKVQNGMEAFTQLKDQGLIVPAAVGAKDSGFRPVRAIGFPQSSQMVDEGKTFIGSWYAPKEIADEINKVFGEKASVNPLLKFGSNVSGKVQDITMSGGLPGTPVNAWTSAQMLKEVLAGRIKSPIQSLFAGRKYFDSKIDTIKRMQQNDISVNIGRSINDLSAPQGLGVLGNVWNKVVNDPTFKRFSPALQIHFFEDISNSLQKKGYSLEQADSIAAKAVKNFYGSSGIYKDATSNPTIRAAVKTFFFAPKYRESIVNFWVNSIKGLKNPLAPENINNTKFLAGAAITIGAMDQANRMLTGHGMTENPQGMEDKLMIPLSKITGNTDDDTVVAIPFLSSIATLPRLGARTIGNVLKGDVTTAVKDVGGTLLSQPIKPAFDIMKNEDYFGKQISEDSDAPMGKWIKNLKYYANQFNHPYLKELFSPTNQKDPAYQRLSRAMELPIRYYTQKQIDTKYYYGAKDEAYKKLDTQSQQAYNAIPKSDSNDPDTRILKYQIYLTYPSVFEAKQKTELETAARTGKAIDPLYLVDYETAKRYMRYESLPEGSQDRKEMTKAYPDLVAMFDIRSQYFDENPLPNSQSSSRPIASADVQAAMDAKNWTYPGVREYLDANTAYNNAQREKLGLPPLAGYSSYGSGKKLKKITFKKSASKKFNISLPKTSKVQNIKIAKLAKPKTAKSKTIKIASTKMKPISFKKIKGPKVGTTLV